MYMTKHASKDNARRLEYIQKNLGIGEEVFVVVTDNQYGKRRLCVTSTGLIIVKGFENNMIITFFIGSLDKVIELWELKTGTTKLPPELFKTVKNNKQHRIWCKEYELMAA